LVENPFIKLYMPKSTHFGRFGKEKLKLKFDNNLRGWYVCFFLFMFWVKKKKRRKKKIGV